MPHYSEEFREQSVRKMMAPNAQSVAAVSRESGVSEQTLYNWRNRFRHQGKAVPADPSNPENWSGENKLAVVIETAVLNEEELAEYCRRKGLYVEQITRWREAAIAGAETPRPCAAPSAGSCSRIARRFAGWRRSCASAYRQVLDGGASRPSASSRWRLCRWIEHGRARISAAKPWT